MANNENLKPRPPFTREEAQKFGRLGAIKSVEVRRQKKFLSQIYGDFLAEKHQVKIQGEVKEMEGYELVAYVTKNVLSKGNSASVSMLKELREATEGTTLNITPKPQNKEELFLQLEKFAKRDGLTLEEYCEKNGIDLDQFEDVKQLPDAITN